MALVVLDQGEISILDNALIVLFDTYEMKLFQNNHTPAADDTNGDYTEATFAGYTAEFLGGWAPAFTNGSGRGQTDHPLITFTQNLDTPANSIYGYYITNTLGNVVWAERNPAGVVEMDLNGKTYTVLPRFTFFSEF